MKKLLYLTLVVILITFLMPVGWVLSDSTKKDLDPSQPGDSVSRTFEKFSVDKLKIKLSRDYDKEHPYSREWIAEGLSIKVAEISQLPMVDNTGTKVEVGWSKQGTQYKSKNNLFYATVTGTTVEIVVKNDQPGGLEKNSKLVFNPTLYVGGLIRAPVSVNPTLLFVDPTNENYSGNILEWDYGVCKRWLRLIEGEILGSWIFFTDPNADIRIKYNQSGDFRLNLSDFAIDNDTEFVSAIKFDTPIPSFLTGYPVSIRDSTTFYPDANPESTSVDGYVRRDTTNEAWTTKVNGAGTGSADSDNSCYMYISGGTTNTWNDNVRPILIFDTSDLEDTISILDANFYFRTVTKTDSLDVHDQISWAPYTVSTTANTSLIASDYNRANWSYSTPLAPSMNYTDLTVDAWSDFEFNSAGLGAISKTGVTKLGILSNFDSSNISPPWSGNYSYVEFSSSDRGTGYKPYLIVVFTSAVDNTITLDGSWQGYSTPAAVRYVGTHDHTYFTFISTNGYLKIGQYDHATGITSIYLLKDIGDGDTHGSPSMLVRNSDHKIVVFTNTGHNSVKLSCFISTNAEDISSFGSEITIGVPSAGYFTYSNAVQLSGEANKMYVFTRWWDAIDTSASRQACFTSTDGGATWSAQLSWMYSGNATSTAYMMVATNNVDKIYFAHVWHSTEGEPIDVYGFYYYNSKVYKIDGTEIGSVPGDLPVLRSEMTLIEDSPSTSGILDDVALDSSGNFDVAYRHIDGSGNYTYYHSIWNGSSFDKETIVNENNVGATWLGAFNFVRGNPEYAYISVAGGPGTYDEIQLYHRVAPNWVKIRDITTGSAETNGRPVAVIDGSGSMPVMWNREISSVMYIYAYIFGTVATGTATSITDTTATCGGNITSLGPEGDNFTIRGIQWGTSTGVYTTNVTEAGSFGVGTYSEDLTSLPSGTTIYYRAEIYNTEVGWSYGDEESFATEAAATNPTVVTNAAVSITTTSANTSGNVTSINDTNITIRGLEWDIDSGAPYSNNWTESGTFGTGYFSQVVATFSPGTLYYFRAIAKNDADFWGYGSELTLLTLPSAPTGITASDGTYTDRVLVSWTKSTGATEYQVYRDTVGLGWLGDIDTSNDTGADAPTITPGTTSASDGLYVAYVLLSLSGQSTTVGTTHTYVVRAKNATGESVDSSNNTGYRGVGSLGYQWYRSAADSDASYSSISGGNITPYNDTGAPSDGSGRYFKCLLSADGASSAYSTSNRGYRATAQTYFVIYVDGIEKGIVNITGLTVNNNLNNWTSCYSSATPYVEFQKIWIDGVLVQSVAWEYGTTFNDLSAFNNDATPTFRTTCSDPDVTATLISFTPIAISTVSSDVIDDWPSMVTTPPDQPATTYTEETRPGIFFEPIVYAIWVVAGGLPESLFFYNFAFFWILATGILVYWAFAKQGKDALLLKIIAMGAVMVFFALPGPNIYGMYVVIYFALWSFGVLVLSRSYGW